MTHATDTGLTLTQADHRHAIQRVLRRYCRGIDRADVETLKSVFHPDAVNDDRGELTNAHQWAEAIIPVMRSMFSGTMHHITNFDIQLDGDLAVSESYYIAYHQLIGGEEMLLAFAGRGYVERVRASGQLDGGHEYIGKGRYFHRWARRDGEWRMMLRVATFEFNQLRPTTAGEAGSLLAAMPTLARRGREDPVFALLAGKPIAGIDEPR